MHNVAIMKLLNFIKVSIKLFLAFIIRSEKYSDGNVSENAPKFP